MKMTAMTNETLWGTDFAANEKRAALQRMTNATRNRSTPCTQGVGNCWMQDVSASDARSVKAWLNGRGDCRVMIWKMKNFLSKLIGIPPALVQQVGPTISKKGGQWAWKLDWEMSSSNVQVISAN